MQQFVSRVLRSARARFNRIGCSIVVSVLTPVLRGVAKTSGLVLLPPSAPRSLGDEAIVAGYRKVISRDFTVLEYSRLTRWSPRWSANAIDLGSYWSTGSWVSFARVLIQSRRFEKFDMLGADVLDGRYSLVKSERRLQLALALSRSGVRVRILSFSWNEQPAPLLNKRMSKLARTVTLRPRDPVSADRLGRLVGASVVAAPDLAFYLDADHSTAVAAITRGIVGSRIVAIVPRTEGDGSKLGPVNEALANAVGQCFSGGPDAQFLLIPHDVGGGGLDYRNCGLIGDHLTATFQVPGEAMTIVRDGLTAAETKALLKAASVVATGKMHAAIGALSQAVPAVSTEYQGKFSGLYKWLSIQHLLVSETDPLLESRLAAALYDAAALDTEQLADSVAALTDGGRSCTFPGE